MLQVFYFWGMINWHSVKIQLRTTVILPSLTLKLSRGEALGILGPNSSGKSILAKALAGLVPVIGEQNSKNYRAEFVSFQSHFQLKHGARAYRQQRWNPVDPELIPTVRELFAKVENQNMLKERIQQFNFEELLDRLIISLSNGEQRKFELIKALAESPDLLVIDNAFNGLDKSSRALLNEMLNQLVDQGQTLVLTGLKVDDFPEKLQHYIYIDLQKNCHQLTRATLPLANHPINSTAISLPPWKEVGFSEIIALKNVSLNMGEKSILKNISWTVKAGECWVLSGENGSGKTSLLNMIFADNPRAYQCDIRLFRKQKGSGESIWEIKDLIGFVSPEMHQYWPGKTSVNDTICSGFFGSEGTYRVPTSYQRKQALNWLALLGIQHLSDRSFETLSDSAQRMVLVLRTLVRNPPLLILDEPFQGLDQENIQRMKNLLNAIAQNTNCAMIFVSHFEDEIPEAFKLELKLNKGKIELIGKRKYYLEAVPK
jgi:molybdate transport system ATP-binding protein